MVIKRQVLHDYVYYSITFFLVIKLSLHTTFRLVIKEIVIIVILSCLIFLAKAQSQEDLTKSKERTTTRSKSGNG